MSSSLHLVRGAEVPKPGREGLEFNFRQISRWTTTRARRRVRLRSQWRHPDRIGPITPTSGIPVGRISVSFVFIGRESLQNGIFVVCEQLIRRLVEERSEVYETMGTLHSDIAFGFYLLYFPIQYGLVNPNGIVETDRSDYLRLY